MLLVLNFNVVIQEYLLHRILKRFNVLRAKYVFYVLNNGTDYMIY